MADTRWCPRCGAEYRPGTGKCADCGVPLVDIGPRESDGAAIDSEPVAFDLTEWDQDSLSGVSWMLDGVRIPYKWERPGVLVVPGAVADQAESFIDYVAAGGDDAPLEPSDDDWRAAAAGPMGQAVMLNDDEFYDGDPARMDSAEVTFGEDWHDERGVQCEVSWIVDTGELFILSTPPRIPPQVEILADIAAQGDVEALLSGWEEAMPETNSIEWVRERVRNRRSAPRVPRVTRIDDDAPASEAPDDLGRADVATAVAQLDDNLKDDAAWWNPPASIGWITPHLEDLRSSYLLARSTMEPDDALDTAIGGLDDGIKAQLEEFLAGEMDVVYGTGTGAQTRTGLRNALESQR